jgi:Tfp pilus assembly protein PilV
MKGNFGISGQSILEIVVALAIGTILIVGAVTAISSSLRVDVESTNQQIASFLNQELANNVSAFSASNWRNIYDLGKSPDQFYLVDSGGVFTTSSGNEMITVNGVEFDRYFTVENVSRDGGGAIESTYIVANDDPSTQKLKVFTVWSVSGGSASNTIDKYLTRSGSLVFVQTDWIGDFTDPVIEVVSLPDSSYNKFATSTDITLISGSIKIQGL